VAVGIASGQSVVALGMAAAPLVSLVVVPFALSRRSTVDSRQSTEPAPEPAASPPPAPEPAPAPAGPPVDHYDDLASEEIVSLLGSLESPDLVALREYERLNADRQAVLGAIDSVLARASGSPAGA
jgi:hypothetical protein